jgi:hypothetical protein
MIVTYSITNNAPIDIACGSSFVVLVDMRRKYVILHVVAIVMYNITTIHPLGIFQTNRAGRIIVRHWATGYSGIGSKDRIIKFCVSFRPSFP